MFAKVFIEQRFMLRHKIRMAMDSQMLPTKAIVRYVLNVGEGAHVTEKCKKGYI